MIELLIGYATVFIVGVAALKYLGPQVGQGQNVVSRLMAYISAAREAPKAAKNAKFLQTVSAEIYDRDALLERYEDGTWQRTAFENFKQTMTNTENTFPCIYGTKGFRQNELDYLFLDSEELGDPEIAKIAAKGILEYHKHAEGRGKNTSLIIMTPEPEKERSVDDYNNLFWEFMRRLRELDPKPWPTDVPKSTTDQFWCFNFDNTQTFIGVLTPAHKQRMSRHCANLCLVYQPRWVFDLLFKDPKSRKSATTTVRGLVDKYDAIPHSPDISDYALPGTSESRQYFLMDENNPTPVRYSSLDAAA